MSPQRLGGRWVSSPQPRERREPLNPTLGSRQLGELRGELSGQLSRRLSGVLCACGITLAALAASVLSCQQPVASKPSASAAAAAAPTLRLYFLGTVAGAIEPCGCRKDMLGGIDHAAAWLESQKPHAPSALVLGAGPLFFMDPELEESRREQDTWKAEALADSLAHLKLRAWAPGENDHAAGSASLRALAERSGATALGARLRPGKPPIALYEAGGLKVGVAGFGAEPGAKPASAEALRQALQALDAQGAQIRVALLASERGAALRLVEQAPGFDVVAVGKARDQGEANDGPTPAVRIGNTLVVQPPNHLQAVAHVDLYVKGGVLEFEDGSGLEQREELERLDSRIAALRRRLDKWRQQAPRSAAEVQKQYASLRALEAQRGQLSKLTASRPEPGLAPRSASYYSLEEIRESKGSSAAVNAKLGAYYRRVNEHNREAFKSRRPEPPAAGAPSYIGLKACSACHADATEFWKTTRHAKAYFTLASQHKQYNLDCVSCHVTGYDKPGGSTVTHVTGLTDVQCESCHGPGSEHAKAPTDKTRITRSPDPSVCRGCHHEPHVGPDWNVARALPHILGPGHGFPAGSQLLKRTH